MRYLSLVLFIISCSSLNAQQPYQTVFNETFESNKNNWEIVDSDVRKSEIENNKLTDWNGQKKSVVVNTVPVEFDTTKDYRIRFSIANLHNNQDYKYPVYTKKENGKLKQSWVFNTIWGFAWGYADQSNYHALLLKKSLDENGIYRISYKYQAESEYSESQDTDWYAVEDFDFVDTWPVTFMVEKSGPGFSIYIVDKNEEKFILGTTAGTTWYGNELGSYVGFGAKVEMDYITVEVR